MSDIVYSQIPTDNFSTVKLPDDFYFWLWRPALLKIIPPGLSSRRILHWLCHWLHLFYNKDYAVLYIVKNNKILHRSCIIPSSIRCLFMDKKDICVSMVWTDPKYRRQGLATSALRQVMFLMKKPGRVFWYITQDSNHASSWACLKAGFKPVGKAKRVRIKGYFFEQLTLEIFK